MSNNRGWNSKERQDIREGGKALARMRRDKQLSIYQLHIKSGLTEMKISRLENGTDMVSQKEARALCRAFDITPETFNKNLGYSAAAEDVKDIQPTTPIGGFRIATPGDTKVTLPEPNPNRPTPVILNQNSMSTPVDNSLVIPESMPEFDLNVFYKSYLSMKGEIKRLSDEVWHTERYGDTPEELKAAHAKSVVSRALWVIGKQAQRIEFLANALTNKERNNGAYDFVKTMRDLCNEELEKLNKNNFSTPAP